MAKTNSNTAHIEHLTTIQNDPSLVGGIALKLNCDDETLSEELIETMIEFLKGVADEDKHVVLKAVQGMSDGSLSNSKVDEMIMSVYKKGVKDEEASK